MAERQATFGRAVAAGLVTAGATAYAGTRAWASSDDPQASSAAALVGTADAPAVTALALVLLAAWGVVLVTRGRVRVAVALLGAVAALAALVVAVVTALEARDAYAETLSSTFGGSAPDISWTTWPWLAIAVAGVSAALSAYAVLACRTWPEMGRRYDAPGADPAEDDLPEDLAEADEQALWRALDEGRDPTRAPRSTD